jgi:group I intron endonuclease
MEIYTGAAVYIIKNLTTSKFYVGSAINYYQRFYHKSSGHLAKLNKGLHHNIYLQRAWNKYGQIDFVFDIIEKIEDVHKLLEREQFFIDILRACEYGYNINPTAGSRYGTILSDEIKNKISKSRTGKCVGTDNGFFGKQHSVETKKIISDANKGRFIGSANPFLVNNIL